MHFHLLEDEAATIRVFALAFIIFRFKFSEIFNFSIGFIHEYRVQVIYYHSIPRRLHFHQFEFYALYSIFFTILKRLFRSISIRKIVNLLNLIETGSLHDPQNARFFDIVLYAVQKSFTIAKFCGSLKIVPQGLEKYQIALFCTIIDNSRRHIWLLIF